MKWEPVWIYWSFVLFFISMTISYMTVEIGRLWVEHHSRSKALDLLRFYAEKGEEAPASVTEALIAVGSGRKPGKSAPPEPGAAPAPERAYHMARVGGNTVGALGWAGIAWWQMPKPGESATFAIVAVVCAIYCTGLLVAHLVGVFTTPSGWPRDGR